MLNDPIANKPLSQGDIIQDVPFVVLSKAFNVKANNVPGQKLLTCEDNSSIEQVKKFSQGNPLNATQLLLRLQLGMIVTQGCDIDNKDWITLARVFPLTDLIQDVRDATEHNEPLVIYDTIRRLTEGHEHPHLVYLGSPDGKVRYAADLLRIQSFPKDWKKCFEAKRWKTLSNHGLLYAQARISFHSGRLATEQGFWHTLPEDDNSATEAKIRNAVFEAKERLRTKVKK